MKKLYLYLMLKVKEKARIYVLHKPREVLTAKSIPDRSIVTEICGDIATEKEEEIQTVTGIEEELLMMVEEDMRDPRGRTETGNTEAAEEASMKMLLISDTDWKRNIQEIFHQKKDTGQIAISMNPGTGQEETETTLPPGQTDS